MSPLDLFSEPLWQRWTLTLVHFLWQGLVVAGLLAVLLKVFDVRRAQTRYAACLAAMLLMAACPLATFAVLEVSRPEIVTSDLTATAATTELGELLLPDEYLPEANHATPNQGLAHTVVAWVSGLPEHARAVQPYLLAGWVAGVLLLSARLLLGLAGVHWLKRGRRPISTELACRVAPLAKRVGLRSGPRVFASDKIREAVVVGFLRPLVLLPASWLAEMPPDVLGAVIAHELAHIRRWDLWVNLLQKLVETLLFYHPAVWWLSRRLRLEREKCCDELAVAATGERVAYVTALELVARKRLAGRKPVLAAAMGGSKMALLGRVRYILGRAPSHERARWWPVGLLALAVPLAIWFGSTPASGSGPPAPVIERSKATPASAKPGSGSPKPDNEEEALAALKDLGAQVQVDSSGEVTGVNLRNNPQISDASLVRLKGLAKLERVNLVGTKVTDAALEHLKGLTNLKALILDGTEITDAGLVHLKGLSNLEILGLGPHITDAGLVHLKELTSLGSFRLTETEVTDAGLEHLGGLTSLWNLTLVSSKVTDAGLVHLKGLSNLRSLYIADTNITGAGLVQLNGLSRFERLWTSGTQIADAGVESLKSLTNLKRLTLDRSKITDAGLLHLQGLGNLESLTVRNTGITDAGLEHLKDRTNLKIVGLSGTQITDTGLEHLRGLTNLTTLALSSTKITDAGIVHLKGLTSLTQLWIRNTNITDTGLDHLKGLSNLKTLYLQGTKVTDEGMKKLKEALPDCEIAFP